MSHWYCPECDYKNSDASKTCSVCGADRPDTEPKPVEYKEKPPFPWKAAIVAGFAFVTCVCPFLKMAIEDAMPAETSAAVTTVKTTAKPKETTTAATTTETTAFDNSVLLSPMYNDLFIPLIPRFGGVEYPKVLEMVQNNYSEDQYFITNGDDNTPHITIFGDTKYDKLIISFYSLYDEEVPVLTALAYQVEYGNVEIYISDNFTYGREMDYIVFDDREKIRHHYDDIAACEYSVFLKRVS